MKYLFSTDNTNLIITLDTEAGKYNPEITTVNDPNITLENDRIWFYENGKYIRNFSFDHIGTISGVTPTSIADAFTKLNAVIDSLYLLVSPNFKGSIVPTDLATGTEDAVWIATQAGTYPNHGGVVVSANSRAEISRVNGVFSISQTALNLTTYAKTIDLSILAANTGYKIGQELIGETWTDGFYIDTIGVLQSSVNYKYSNYILCVGSVSFSKISGGAGTVNTSHAFYDKNLVFLGSTLLSAASFTTPTDTYYVRLSNFVATVNNIIIKATTSKRYVTDSLDSISEINNKIGLIAGKKATLDGVTGFYINSTGTLVESATSSYIDNFPVTGINTLTLNGNVSGSRAIVLKDKDFKVVSFITNISFLNNYVLDVTPAAYVSFSWVTSVAFSIVSDKTVTFINQNRSDIKSLLTAKKYDDVTIIQKTGVNLLTNTVWNKGYLYASGDFYPSETWKFSDFTPITIGNYNYTGTLAGSAAIEVSDYFKKRLYLIDSTLLTSYGSVIPITDVNAKYIRVSTTNEAVSLNASTNLSVKRYTSSKESALEYNSRLSIKGNILPKYITKIKNEYTISSSFFATKKFRIAYETQFNEDLNSAYESINLLTVLSSGYTTAYLRLLKDIPSALSTVNVGGFTTNYPQPIMRSRFQQYVKSVYTDMKKRSLPHYKEMIGEDMMSLHYRGLGRNIEIMDSAVQSQYSSLDDVLKMSFVGNVLNIRNSATSTNILNLDVTAYTTVKELTDYLSGFLTDFDVKNIAQTTALVSDMVRFPEVVLVSKYPTSGISDSAYHYDSFPCYFKNKYDTSWHLVEIVADENGIVASVDGQTTGVVFDIYEMLNENTSIVLGNNTKGYFIKNLHINIGDCGDAEVNTNFNTIISNYNPHIIPLMGHGVWVGDGCDGKKPIYKSMTPLDSSYANVIPDEYKLLFGETGANTYLADIAMSDKRLVKIVELAEKQGYTYIDAIELRYINNGDLPRKCWTLIFDDTNEYFFSDRRVKSVFDRIGIKPNMAISYYEPSINNADYTLLHQQMRNQNWRLWMHALDHLNVGSMTSEELYNISYTYTNLLDVKQRRKMGTQLDTSNKIFVDNSLWVYGNGSQTINGVQAFAYTGMNCGIMTNYGDGYQVCRAMNKYYIRRENASDKSLFSIIEKLFF